MTDALDPTPRPDATRCKSFDCHGRRAVRAGARLVKILLGVILVALGLVFVFTPFPLGFALTLVGLAILASQTPWVAPGVRAVRRKIPVLDRALEESKHRLPPSLRGFVEATAP